MNVLLYQCVCVLRKRQTLQTIQDSQRKNVVSTGECRHKAITMHYRIKSKSIHESGLHDNTLKRFKVFNLKHAASCGQLRQF